MGGKSTGTFHVDDNVGVFQGSVEIVPFLKAPGFIKAETTKGETWPDASKCDGLQFTLKSSTPSYQGFRVSFGNKRPPDAFPYTYGFKTNLKLDASQQDFQTIRLPFDTFTDKWDAGSGDAVVTCQENKEYCPDQNDKANLFSIAVWGEGIEGKVDLQIQSIAAYGCTSSDETKDGDAENEASAVSSTVDTFVLEDFKNPTHDWRSMNDPVMGGRSKSSVRVEDGMAKFEGTCAIVPFLKAPGFITMVTGGFFGKAESFPDVRACKGLEINLRSSVDYKGYYVSFGTDRAPGGRHAVGYKTPLSLESTKDFVTLQIPFDEFSSKWDEASGKTTVTCQENPKYCPSLDNLKDMKTISFWGEGVEGEVALDVRSIYAYGCDSDYNDLAEADLNASAALPMHGIGTFGTFGTFGWMGIGMVVAATTILVKHQRARSKQFSDYQEVDQVVLESELA